MEQQNSKAHLNSLTKLVTGRQNLTAEKSTLSFPSPTCQQQEKEQQGDSSHLLCTFQISRDCIYLVGPNSRILAARECRELWGFFLFVCF